LFRPAGKIILQLKPTLEMKFITRFLIPVCTLLAGLMCGACSDDDKQIEELMVELIASHTLG
jgi:hypothetical protein